MPADQQPSLMRALGLVVGDLWRTVTGAPPPAQRTEVRRDVEERKTNSPAGQVTLRRTTIEEVEVRPTERPEAR